MVYFNLTFSCSQSCLHTSLRTARLPAPAKFSPNYRNHFSWMFATDLNHDHNRRTHMLLFCTFFLRLNRLFLKCPAWHFLNIISALFSKTSSLFKCHDLNEHLLRSVMLRERLFKSSNAISAQISVMSSARYILEYQLNRVIVLQAHFLRTYRDRSFYVHRVELERPLWQQQYKDFLSSFEHVSWQWHYLLSPLSCWMTEERRTRLF